jgi:hypothetical protein
LPSKSCVDYIDRLTTRNLSINPWLGRSRRCSHFTNKAHHRIILLQRCKFVLFHRPSVRELGLPRMNWMISACPSESTAYDFLASSLLDCEAAQTESCSSGLQYPQNDLKRLTNCKWLRAGIRTFSCHSASSPHFDRCFLCCHHESTTRLLEKAGYVLASLLLRI